jgi:hypothetical protein
MEYSNFVPQGTKHRDLPSTCPAQYRSRIEALRVAPQQLDRDASPKFKTGDHCKVAGEKGGIICKVIKVSSPAGGIVTVQDGLGRTYDLTATFLERVTLTSVAKFKIGESVQVIGGGVVGTVSKVFGNILDIKWSTGEIDTVLADDLEKVERSFSAVARRQRERGPLSDLELLKRAELRQRLWQAERDFTTGDPFMDGAGNENDPGIGNADIDDLEFNSAKHISFASYHVKKADELDSSDQQQDMDKAQAHYLAALAHIQAANVLGSKDASLNSKDAATKAAKKASKLALANVS